MQDLGNDDVLRKKDKFYRIVLKWNDYNTILVDGCIDLLVYYDEKEIGYVGSDKTIFDHTIESLRIHSPPLAAQTLL